MQHLKDWSETEFDFGDFNHKQKLLILCKNINAGLKLGQNDKFEWTDIGFSVQFIQGQQIDLMAIENLISITDQRSKYH